MGNQADLFAGESACVGTLPTLPAPAKKAVSWDLRQGRWQDVLNDVECDALITDAPYSVRTHEGMRIGPALTGSGNPYERTGVIYDSWDAADVAAFVQHWAPRTRGWFVSITDDVLAPIWKAELAAVGRYAFAPLPYLELGKQPRLTGDGPASWACWIVVARPMSRAYQRWGSLPGGYVPPNGNGVIADRIIKGGKPLWLMQNLVRDYSRVGDVVCDPCAGGASTLVAALVEHRSAIGAEKDPQTFAKAQKRLSKGHTPTLFPEEP